MKGKTHGFSLAELLLAVGVIAVLLALTLPAISLVRQRTISANCLQNMRTYGTAVLGYAAENDGLPRWNGTTDRTDGTVYPQFYLWLRNRGYLPGPDTSRHRCPLATERERTNTFGFHYAGNAALCMYYPRLRGIPAPLNRVILAAEMYHQDAFSTASHLNVTITGSPGANPPRRGQYHGSDRRRGIHCFFLDGHIELIAASNNDWGSSSNVWGTATNGGLFFALAHFAAMKEGKLDVR